MDKDTYDIGLKGLRWTCDAGKPVDDVKLDIVKKLAQLFAEAELSILNCIYIKPVVGDD